MSTRFVSVLGSDEVILQGTGFESNSRRFLVAVEAGTYVKIDGRTCSISAQTSTSITCTSNDKPFGSGTAESELKIYIPDKGYAATMGKTITYVSKWSDTQTWGGFPPGEEDAVQIPKEINLLQ